MMLTGRYFATLAPILALVAWGCHGVHAESAASLPMTETQKQAGLLSAAPTMPSPGEFFGALNAVCHPNWVTLVIPATTPVTTDRTQLVLAVGVLVANGYIAIQAQDGQQVKNVGTEMMLLAKSLGLSGNLMGREKSLSEFAEKNEWDALAAELKATEGEITTSMVDQKDEDLVALSAAATWLRGMEVATQVMLSSDTLQGVSMIRQPETARHLASQLEMLPERMKKGPLVSAVKQTLDDTAVLLETMGSTAATEKPALQRIHHETAELVQQIMTSPDAKPSPSPVVPLPAQTPATNERVINP